MTDLLLQFGASNLLVAGVLALAAYVVGRRLPGVAHVLWILVLVKLVTPPLVTLAVVPVPWLSEAPALAVPAPAEPPPAVDVEAAAALGEGTGLIKPGLLAVWGAGSAWVLGWSLVRVRRFSRLLDAASKDAPDPVQRASAEIAGRLGLRQVPRIVTTTARLSPMVWWAGGRVRIVIPESLPQEMAEWQLRWVLAHELAHVRRRDHLVRWLEWLACVVCWWNPVAWWARRQLRMNEEICCDALVLARLKPGARTYADSLMAVVELLAAPAVRPPAVASELNGGGFLERRFTMIMSKRTRSAPRWARAVILGAALGVLPLGVAYGQDYEAIGKRLRAGVEHGELSAEQAELMMGALKKSAAKGQAHEALARAEKELKRAVETGKVSPEEAHEKLIAMKERLEEAHRARTHTAAGDFERAAKEAYARAADELRRAVDAGKISGEEAHEKLADMKRRLAEQARGEGQPPEHAGDLGEHVDRMRAHIHEALEAGKISGEEAHKHLAAMQRKMKELGHERDAEARDAHVKRVHEALKAGAISPEEAHKHLAALHRKLEGHAEEHAAKLRQHLDGIAEHIHEALRAGSMSREEAHRKFDALRKAAGAHEGRKHPRDEGAEDGAVPWKVIIDRLEGAVDGGHLTREQAEGLYRALRERMPHER